MNKPEKLRPTKKSQDYCLIFACYRSNQHGSYRKKQAWRHKRNDSHHFNAFLPLLTLLGNIKSSVNRS